jgi:hypothetical protein
MFIEISDMKNIFRDNLETEFAEKHFFRRMDYPTRGSPISIDFTLHLGIQEYHPCRDYFAERMERELKWH